MNKKLILISVVMIFQIEIIENSVPSGFLYQKNNVKAKDYLLDNLKISNWFVETIFKKINNQKELTNIQAIEKLMNYLNLVIEKPAEINKNILNRVAINISCLHSYNSSLVFFN